MPTNTQFADLTDLVGSDLGVTEWMEVTQDRVNTFADATDDPQWIHVDPERARSGPFGTTIAHGYLTLALVIPLFTELLEVEGVGTKLNYGLNKVRFPAPVKVGSRIRLGAVVREVTEVGGGGRQLTFDATVEIEGSEKPACVAQPVFRFYA
ncbi:MaoC family dehydratase [Segeticoccus rhizosphaerae]|jgi:acyl dehydratase|uniref:MaoC family dehydratase n=1 Tax=Segeticoccus rhizosphaerae TaxID=1104777 RepID=UPI0010C09FE5|nr:MULTISPECIES: MaoC family dehydratase [Intrasporangiaceae]